MALSRTWVALFALAFLPNAHAQILRPPEAVLHYAYPAGGQQGQTVAVELGGSQGLDGASSILIDGPDGITVRDVKAVSSTTVQATFVIAKDAVPGRRLVRVAGGSNGLTSFRYFFVGQLPETLEKEPNNTPKEPQPVTIPTVIHGRLNPQLDVDCYRFTAKAGQKIVAAVLAYGMDSRMRTRANPGYVDASLELTDAAGKVLASAEDTLGLDPLIEATIPADGQYTVRVQAAGFEGAPGAVYRLALGEVPYPTAVFPPGGQRGKTVEVEFTGPNVPPQTKQKVTLPADGFPWQTVRFDNPQTDGFELPFLMGDHPEVIEREPNEGRTHAEALTLPVTVNARFDRSGDEDWYRVSLRKGQGMLLEVTAQRHLRSPVDTLVEVFDVTGKKVAENDDGALFAGQCEHDFPSSDSRLEFTAPADGDYWIRVTDQNGVGGPRAIYRLTVEPLQPDFRLHQWPDAVPIWGPGTTAAFVIQVQRWGGLTGDIQLRIEGLPEGWTGSGGIACAAAYYAPNQGLNQKPLLTITAPAKAAVGTIATFRVVGRVEQDGKVIERVAMPQTLYGSSHTDRMHLRYSPLARAVVAPPQDCWLETSVKELTVPLGGTVQVPVKVHRKPDAKGAIGISIDGETPAAGSGWRTPLTLKPDENEVTLSLEVKEKRPGTYGIVVSRSWAADLRAGRPGPCTQLILLHVKPAEKK